MFFVSFFFFPPPFLAAAVSILGMDVIFGKLCVCSVIADIKRASQKHQMRF